MGQLACAASLVLLLRVERARAEPQCSVVAADRRAPSGHGKRRREESARWLNLAYRHKANHRDDAAQKAFEESLRRGADPQLVFLELGYLAAERNDGAGARRCFESALVGAREDLRDRAQSELAALAPEGAPAAPPPLEAEPPADPAAKARELLEDAYRKKAHGDAAAAAAAFAAARDAGADPQLVSLELGYLAASGSDIEGARARFREAEQGPNADLRARATQELGALAPEQRLVPVLKAEEIGRGEPRAPEGTPESRRRFRADLYADAFGWRRIEGNPVPADLVATMRLRLLYRPALDFDFDFYAFGQGTRDVASRTAPGISEIYADDYAIAGLGALLRLWNRHVVLFVQAGRAESLLDPSGQPARWDVRGGGAMAWEAASCAPPPAERPGFIALPCAETYSEGVYVSRFDNNVIGFTRARAGISYFALGPVLSQLVVEGRAAADRNHDYYNNFVDGGVGDRLRLVAPFRFDVMAGVHLGSYLGVANRDPAPSQLRYLEFRLQAATYVEF